MSSRSVSPKKRVQTPKNVKPAVSPRFNKEPNSESKPLDQETKTLAGVAVVFVSYIMYAWGSCNESRLTNISTTYTESTDDS